MKLSELPVFFLDLQTTGSRPGESDILEIAWADLAKPEIHSALVLPTTGFVPRRIQMLTGITDSDMQEAVDLPSAMAQLEEFLTNLMSAARTPGEKPRAIIHFAQFEKPFLLHAYELLEKELPFEILCTHQISKRLMPNLPTRGIKGLAGYFGYNSGELKRSSSHVEATRFIWKGLTEALQAQNIHTAEDLQTWLQDTPATKRKKYEYPLPKEKRLNLPDEPGVYRMVSRWGEILYVGKATSLHSRVNSYFRGQKNRDPRKLEMLTQTWDLQVTPCGSPLESALLETDEIKRLNPRYNISLKTGGRAMVFFDHEFTSLSYQQDDAHPIGPFSNSMVMDAMIKLSQSVRKGVYNSVMFFEPISSELLEAGFQVFCERHGFEPSDFVEVRSILAVGLSWLRKDEQDAKRAHEASHTASETADSGTDTEDSEANDGFGEVRSPLDLEGISEEELEALLVLNPEDVADKFERHFRRAARAYMRARQLTKLLNSDIDFQIHGAKEHRFIKVRRGQLQYDHLKPKAGAGPATTATADSRADLDGDSNPNSNPDKACFEPNPWRGLSIDTYDRMSILTSELQKIRSQDGTVVVRNCSNLRDS